MNKGLMSGEPLPIPPKTRDPELEAFHRKLIDYLRRLVGKLDRYVVDSPGGGGPALPAELPSVMVFTTFDQDVSGSLTAIQWDKTLWLDEEFDHDKTGDLEKILIREDGLYAVHLDYCLYKSGLYDTYVLIRISDPDGSNSFYPMFSKTRSDTGTSSFNCLLPIAENKVLMVFIYSAYDELGGFLADNARLSLIQVRKTIDGGTNTDHPALGWNDGADWSVS